MIEAMVIGGTGVGHLLAELPGKHAVVPTSAGAVHGKVVTLGSKQVFAVQRHSLGHQTPPHAVNYEGFTRAAQQLGVKAVLSSAAVGCLRREWGPGTFVACSDFYDFTYRGTTLFEHGVQHVDFTHPFAPNLRQSLVAAGRERGIEVQPEGIYMGLNGPRYETPKEIEQFAQWKADLVGMTASTEAILMREAGMPYSCLAVVTNLAAGISETELHHGEVTDVMVACGPKVLQLFTAVIEGL